MINTTRSEGQALAMELIYNQQCAEGALIDLYNQACLLCESQDPKAIEQHDFWVGVVDTIDDEWEFS